jgi:hypothetical protein
LSRPWIRFGTGYADDEGVRRPDPSLATSSNGTQKFVPALTLPIKDQFGVMTVDVKKPSEICLSALESP